MEVQKEFSYLNFSLYTISYIAIAEKQYYVALYNIMYLKTHAITVSHVYTLVIELH